jgi:hypothetical protein
MAKKYRVSDYQSGDSLPGRPSSELVEASLSEGPTGAVSAYRDESGVWQYVEHSEVEHYRRNLRETVRTVFVEETSGRASTSDPLKARISKLVGKK